MIKVSLTCINFNLWKGLHQIRVKTTYHKYAANNSNRAKVYSHLFVASVFNRRSETERNKILSSLSRSFPAYKGSAAFPFSTRTVLPVNRYPLTRIYIYITLETLPNTSSLARAMSVGCSLEENNRRARTPSIRASMVARADRVNRA